MKHRPFIVAATALAVNLSACNEMSPDTDSRATTPPPKSSEATPPARSQAQATAQSPQSAADLALSGKVRRALQAPDGPGGLEVDASNGVVTLYGTVEAPGEKDRAALVALGVDGVRSVVNNLVVIRGS